jgi:hypothetical protein
MELLNGIRKQAALDAIYGQSGETTPLHYAGGAAIGSFLASILSKRKALGGAFGAAGGAMVAHLLGDKVRKDRMAAPQQ